MTPEELREKLSKIDNPEFYRSKDVGDEVYRKVPPELLFVGFDVLVADESDSIEHRKQQLAEEIFQNIFCQHIHEIQAEAECLSPSGWLYDDELDIDVEKETEALASAIVEKLMQRLTVASPVVAEFKLTPELLSVIHEHMGVNE